MLLETISTTAPSNRIIIINLTHKCNFNCWYCYDKNNRGSTEFLNFEYIKIFIDAYTQNYKDPLKIVLMGGEPTLHPDLFEIIVFLNNSNIVKSITLVTNLSDSYDNYARLYNDKLEIMYSYHFNKYSIEQEEKALLLKENNHNIVIEFMVDDKVSLHELEEKYNYLSSKLFSINKKQLYNVNYSKDIKIFAQRDAKRFVKFIYDDHELDMNINTIRNLTFNPFQGMYCDSFKLIWNIDNNGKIKQNCSNNLYNIFDGELSEFFKIAQENTICKLNRCNCWVEIRKYKK